MLDIVEDSSEAGDEEPVYDQLVRAKVPCHVRAVSGGEVIRGRQIEADITHMIETRYYDQLNHEHVLKWGTETLHISRILPDDMKREMTIMATVKRD